MFKKNTLFSTTFEILSEYIKSKTIKIFETSFKNEFSNSQQMYSSWKNLLEWTIVKAVLYSRNVSKS